MRATDYLFDYFSFVIVDFTVKDPFPRLGLKAYGNANCVKESTAVIIYLRRRAMYHAYKRRPLLACLPTQIGYAA